MPVTIIGLVALGAWAIAATRGLSACITVTLIFLPFGAAAAARLGGLNLLCAHVLAVLTIGYCLVLMFQSRNREEGFKVHASMIALGVFAAYGIFSAIVLPRLFYHDVNVVPMALVKAGERVSREFRSVLIPLEPSKTNISQSAYIFVSAAFFVITTSLAARRTAAFLHKALVAVAFVHLSLALLDLLKIRPILSLIRTADYQLLTSHQMNGFTRIVAGFPEASASGGFSAMLFAYFLLYALNQKNDTRSLILALACGFTAIASLSSTGFAGFAIACLFAGPAILAAAMSGTVERQRALIISLFVVSLVIGLTIVLATTSFGTTAQHMLDTLVFNKASSQSGTERSFLGARGLVVFFETYGLGAGAGSLRANGLLATLLGNVGLPGLISMTLFLWFAFSPFAMRAAIPNDEAPRTLTEFRAARAAALTAVATMMLSGSSPDLGLGFFAFAAVAVAARMRLLSTVPVTRWQQTALPATPATNEQT